MEWNKLIMLICIGLGAGYLSGFVGIGGGIIMVPALVMLMGSSQFSAQGTSLAVLSVPVGILGVYSYYKMGHVNFWFAGLIAAGFVLGSFFGAKSALKIDPLLVRRIFGVFMLLIAIKFISGK
jgi:uncharacterized protein